MEFIIAPNLRKDIFAKYLMQLCSERMLDWAAQQHLNTNEEHFKV